MLSRIDRFKQLVEMEPDSEISHFGLGSVYFDEGAFDPAVDSFRRAIEIKPDYTAAYELLGRSLEKAGRKEEAKAVYEKGVEVGRKAGDHIPTQKMEDRLRRFEKDSGK